MDEQMIEPCPFCGGPASLKADVDYRSGLPSGMWWVQCDPCDTFPESAWCKPKDEAIAAWNRRAAHSVIAGKVAELIELLLDAQADLNHLCDKYGEQEFIAPTICRITAALAPYPERRSE